MKNKSVRIGLICALLAFVVMSSTACSATWVQAVGAGLPTIQALLAAILAFAAGLSGKTISASVSATIQKISEDAKASLDTVAGLIADYNNSPDPTLVGRISSALNDAVSKLNSIFAGVSITNEATVSKLTQLIGLAVAAIQAALALVPLFGVAGTDKISLSKVQVNILKKHADTFKDGFNSILDEPSGDAQVDAVLKGIKRA